jgi:hypothetical protein
VQVSRDLRLKEKKGPVYNCFGFNQEPEESIDSEQRKIQRPGGRAEPQEGRGSALKNDKYGRNGR